MTAGLRVWWRAFRHLNHYGFRYIWTNLAWFLMSIPVVTAPASWMALITVSHRLHQGQAAGLNEFWEAFKANFWRGLVMAGLNAVVIGLNVFNLLNYRQADSPLTVVVRSVWALTLIVWIVAQFYVYPLLLEMEKPNLVQAMRNALIMLWLNPFFSLTIMLGVLALVILSSVFIVLWMLLTGAMLAIVSTGAVLNRLEAAGLRAPRSDPTDAPEVNDMNIT